MTFDYRSRLPAGSARRTVWAAALWVCFTAGGCFAPLHTSAIPATSLPDDFRLPLRTAGPLLNYSQLTLQPPPDYLLGANDVLEVTVPGLFQQSEIHPLRVQVMATGEIQLPLVGAVNVGGMNLQQAHRTVNDAYANGFLREPRVNVVLAQKATVSVLVLGQVVLPGAHALPKYENDVGHALGAAQGFADEAADYIEVHRRSLASAAGAGTTFERLPTPPSMERLPVPGGAAGSEQAPYPHIFRIPLRGPHTELIQPEDIVLHSGDVIVVPNRKNEVFYVVGKLSTTNTVRFTVGNRERELGVGFVLPRDREIDVVTAVAMAGYIDPIDSPTTVTVQRLMPDGMPLLIHVDLIKARYNPRASVLVQPGDIIYLNPDGAWWLRRTLDGVIGNLINTPYNRWILR